MNMSRRTPALLLLTLLGMLLALPARAADRLEPESLDRLAVEALEKWSVPGAVVAVVKPDEIIYLKGAGRKAIESETAVTPETVFPLASLTKAFTTTAMAMLVDDGKMAWDDPVRKHLALFRLGDPLADAQVTLRDLVTHRTGVSRHDLMWLGTDWSQEEILTRIAQVELSRSFRGSYQYQNIMYSAAGAASAEAAGSSWEELIRRRITEPLGMTGASFTHTAASEAADRATGHHKNKEGVVRTAAWTDLKGIEPAGGINATGRDVAAWMRLHLGEGMFDGKRLVSGKNLLETHTPQVVMPMSDYLRAVNPETVQMSYGMGWMVQDYRGQPLVFHMGNIGGFSTRVSLLPRQKIGVAVLANLSSTPMNQALSKAILDRILDAPERDWNRLIKDEVAKQDERDTAARKEKTDRRHKDTKPSRPLEAYAGKYESPAYGIAEVSLADGVLALQWLRAKTPLEHVHFDTFTTKEGLLEDETVIFRLDAAGDVAELETLGSKFKRLSTPPPPPAAASR